METPLAKLEQRLESYQPGVNLYRYDYFPGDEIRKVRDEYERSLARRTWIRSEQERLKPDPRVSALQSVLADTALEAHIDAFIYAADTFDVPVQMLAAITAHETGWGRSELFSAFNNPGGIKCTSRVATCHDGFSAYTSVADGLLDKAGLLRKSYFNRGRTTLTSIREVYCPEAGCETWVRNIADIMYRIEEEFYR